jgi:hypothetical protein
VRFSPVNFFITGRLCSSCCLLISVGLYYEGTKDTLLGSEA